ncbi:MAG: hypothetical protein QXP91_02130 [Candidatus Methanomethylicia archaeon]
MRKLAIYYRDNVNTVKTLNGNHVRFNVKKFNEALRDKPKSVYKGLEVITESLSLGYDQDYWTINIMIDLKE